MQSLGWSARWPRPLGPSLRAELHTQNDNRHSSDLISVRSGTGSLPPTNSIQNPIESSPEPDAHAQATDQVAALLRQPPLPAAYPLCRRPPLLRISQPKIGHRQFSVSRRKSRVLLDGLFEVSYRLLPLSFAFEGGAGKIQAVQVIILRFRIRGATAGKTIPLLRCQLNLDFVGDGAGNLALQGQSVANAAIVFLGPQLALGEGLR